MKTLHLEFNRERSHLTSHRQNKNTKYNDDLIEEKWAQLKEGKLKPKEFVSAIARELHRGKRGATLIATGISIEIDISNGKHVNIIRLDTFFPKQNPQSIKQ